VSWPPTLAGSPAVAVIERAIARQRLGHSLLLHGDDLETLAAVAEAIAERLLHPPGAGADFRPSAALGSHPDCFALRPAGKARQISADATRELIAQVQMSPRLAPCKVAIIHEADRMNTISANIFLKTLEEPPERTVLLLLTTHPYALLPTIRSRCLHFRFPAADGGSAGAEGWSGWLGDYGAWLGRLVEGTAGKGAAAAHVMTLYGLVARFGAILEQATARSWEAQKPALPPDLGENEQVAIETGLANGWRSRLFADIEHATRAFARPRFVAGDAASHRAFAAAIQRLEHDAALLRLNLNESAVLEDFLLGSLRLWSRPARGK
jgi:DNA polymerase-3 subunit delta'